jgi:hypothetical protein
VPDPFVQEIDAPAMNGGAPAPEIAATDNSLVLTYYGPDPRKGRVRIAFNRPRVHYFGPPNDEALHGHPLWAFGLRHYGTFEVLNSRWIDELRNMNRVHPRHVDALFDGLRHYIWTFKDGTFECLARGFAVE